MADYRVVKMCFWTDSKVFEDFTPEDKYFYLYLLTNPHTNLCGCYELSIKQMSIELGYSVESVKVLIDRFSTYHNVIRYSCKTKEILLLNWYKHNWTTSDKYLAGVENSISSVKDTNFRDYLEKLLESDDRVSIPYPYPMDTSITITNNNTLNNSNNDIDRNKESNNLNKSKKKIVKPENQIPPTLEMVTAYCEERKNGIDAQRFIDFYESKGWMVGKNKMKNWQAAIGTWEQRDKAEKEKKPEIKKSQYDFAALQKMAEDG